MKKKKEEMLIAKNVFKVSDFKTQKKSFNERFEKYYIQKRLHLFIGGNSYEKFNRYICKIV